MAPPLVLLLHPVNPLSNPPFGTRFCAWSSVAPARKRAAMARRRGPPAIRRIRDADMKPDSVIGGGDLDRYNILKQRGDLRPIGWSHLALRDRVGSCLHPGRKLRVTNDSPGPPSVNGNPPFPKKNAAFLITCGGSRNARPAGGSRQRYEFCPRGPSWSLSRRDWFYQ